MSVERVRVPCGRGGDVADAYGLERDRGEPFPASGGVHLLLEPLCIGKVPAEASLEALHAHIHEIEPELERAEASAELDVPIPVVLHLPILLGVQIARIGAHDADKVLRIAHIIGAEIEAHAHPFVRVENGEFGALDARPFWLYPEARSRAQRSAVRVAVRLMRPKAARAFAERLLNSHL